VEGECGEDAAGVGFEGGSGQAGGFAGVGHFFNAAPLGVDVAGFKTGGGEERVAGLGGMRAQEGLGGEVVGEIAFVPEREAGIVNATLDVDAAAVGFVDEGVQEGFAEGFAGIGRGLVAVEAFEADSFDEEFPVEALEDFGQGVDEVVFDDFVEAEVGVVVQEATEAHADSGVEAEGVFSEKDDGGALEAAIFGEAEFFEEVGDGKRLGIREAVGLAGVGQKALDGGGVDVVERGAVLDDGVPCEAGLVDEEFVERGALEFLGNAAVALVIAASEGNRNGGGGHADFKGVEAVGRQELDGWRDAEELRDFLREFLEEALGIGNADGLAEIIVAEEEVATSGIGKAAEDLEVVIVPSGFPFDGLVFRHGSGKSEKDEVRRQKGLAAKVVVMGMEGLFSYFFLHPSDFLFLPFPVRQYFWSWRGGGAGGWLGHQGNKAKGCHAVSGKGENWWKEK